MPVFQNILRKGKNQYQGLQNFDVLIDTTDNKYFNVSDFPEELTLGNSSFLIEGSDLLKVNVELKLEILDSAGNVIFTSPVDEYLEGRARRISIEAYSETEPGPATLVILGELDPTKTNVPNDFINTYNLRYTKNFFINTNKLNTRPILFYGQPTVSGTEIVRGQIDSVQSEAQSTQTITGTINLDVDVSVVEEVEGFEV